jgi:hypothetical protein
MKALFRSMASDMLPGRNISTVAEFKTMSSDGNHEWLFMTSEEGEDGGEAQLNVSRFTGPAACAR